MNENLTPNFHEMANYMEYLLLAPQLSQQETVAGCLLADKLQVSSVIVKPCYVKQAVDELRASSVAVGTVVGFPLGANSTYVKVSEVKRALIEGAAIIEMMINAGYVRDLADDLVRRDIQAVCGIVHMNGGTVNVILPFDYLLESQIIRSAKIASETGVNGIMISGEFLNTEDLFKAFKAVKDSVGSRVQVKVMGGVSTLRAFRILVEAGCECICVKDLDHLTRVFEAET